VSGVSDKQVDLAPEAILEIEEAFDWYLERSPGAAEAFLVEIDQGLTLITTSPGLWPLFEAGARKYVLPNFPYNLIYREAADEIKVVAVAHHKRRPRYWIGR
jgi:toxin ParE1/3/4